MRERRFTRPDGVGGEVISDGTTVWVNIEPYGANIGRFGRQGIDIHHNIDEQRAKGECLQCSHAETTKEDWPKFVDGMLFHHGVKVPLSFIPKRFQ